MRSAILIWLIGLVIALCFLVSPALANRGAHRDGTRAVRSASHGHRSGEHHRSSWSHRNGRGHRDFRFEIDVPYPAGADIGPEVRSVDSLREQLERLEGVMRQASRRLQSQGQLLVKASQLASNLAAQTRAGDVVLSPDGVAFLFDHGLATNVGNDRGQTTAVSAAALLVRLDRFLAQLDAQNVIVRDELRQATTEYNRALALLTGYASRVPHTRVVIVRGRRR